MNLSLPQTYLIGLSVLLAIIAVLVGRQVLKVRKDEIELIKLEQSGNSESNDSAKLYELASVQLKKRLYPQAIATLKKSIKALKDEPNDAKAIIENALGFALAAQDKFKEAITHYQKAIKEKPDYPVAINNLAFAKLKLLEENEAFELYQSVLTMDPKNKTAKKQISKMQKRKEFSTDNIVYKKGF
ncbi:tetratricopeptide repeat protein [Prochlorococcus marinus]|uniref:Putative photosystem I assembly related protein Ycf37 n=1 Tax=Prochlorococcus marinus (strain MIT 9211) TaxID=93059 RepID=A9BDA7_PROM4|nr:tetratricopeptide repeat protein [Prochlorococcus marinus]ABX09720.1 putative photosystem I assembly related protein Ycf37 [Prochlorococcus marinus str. MIT 9211]